MLDFILPVSMALVITSILSFLFRRKDKVDRGFKINYYQLSYRRKMIRTLISLPFVIFSLIVIYLFTEWSVMGNILVGLFFCFVFLTQLFYTYYMWQKQEQ